MSADQDLIDGSPGDAAADGYFAKKQLFTRSRLINWSHGSRFRLGVELARRYATGRILDYGCGDGTFLGMLMKGPAPPMSAVGAELNDGQVVDCQERMADPRLTFVKIARLNDEEHRDAFDAVVCMEVLEHVVERRGIFELWRNLLKPGGRLIVSVPVEIGPVLLAKQVMRRIAGWRGIGDYPGMAPYTWKEMFASLLAGRRQHMVRPEHRNPDGTTFHCHKGFNWRVLRSELSEYFMLERQFSSPLGMFPAGWGSQAWFVLRNNQTVGAPSA